MELSVFQDSQSIVDFRINETLHNGRGYLVLWQTPLSVILRVGEPNPYEDIFAPLSIKNPK